MNKKKETISILGCGWLGLPLSEALIRDGFSVKGSTTSSEKMQLLKTKNIQPFLIELSESKIQGDIDLFLKDASLLIIDIPPKLRSVISENFVQKIKNLIPFITESSVEKVLFVSSTSVYADQNKTITEATLPNPDTESGKQLWEVEQLLQNNPNFKTTIVRFGGLLGEERHPIKQLAGKENLENPDAPINMIHQKDCIGILQAIIEKQAWNEQFNAVAPFHPTRKEFYQRKAQELNLPLPTFVSEKPSLGKLISSEKTETVLNYTFRKKEL
ncbi:SDR family oxidoreductase [Flavobacterium sp. SM15]|uniref:SDR family oxidoreductase n=1 Tax=Flavobacterium sp. SM15 TaxID=2908005 RepID=UPI001EDACACB|nr:SDR family oxidoreductase [Flavobacterium sp. SM15]MCG2610263.1 SDR family oxidoreductase [Flavobacterium sp. SM15]